MWTVIKDMPAIIWVVGYELNAIWAPTNTSHSWHNQLRLWPQNVWVLTWVWKQHGIEAHILTWGAFSSVSIQKKKKKKKSFICVTVTSYSNGWRKDVVNQCLEFGAQWEYLPVHFHFRLTWQSFYARYRRTAATAYSVPTTTLLKFKSCAPSASTSDPGFSFLSPAPPSHPF